MIISIAKVTSDPMLAFSQLGPVYISPDLKIGTKEAEMFFPPDETIEGEEGTDAEGEDIEEDVEEEEDEDDEEDEEEEEMAPVSSEYDKGEASTVDITPYGTETDMASGVATSEFNLPSDSGENLTATEEGEEGEAPSEPTTEGEPPSEAPPTEPTEPTGDSPEDVPS